MTSIDDGDPSDDFDQYRRYLRSLARSHLSGKYQNRIDPSDVVQQTLLRAHEKKAQYRGKTKNEKLGWLRRILIRYIQHAVRNLNAQRRDVKRETAIEHDIEQSSMRLGIFLASKTPEPSRQVSDQETALAIANAIEALSEIQREVIVRKYWHGSTFRQIAEELEISIPAAAGYYYRVKQKLKKLLSA